jgi:hypothetical protein
VPREFLLVDNNVIALWLAAGRETQDLPESPAGDISLRFRRYAHRVR